MRFWGSVAVRRSPGTCRRTDGRCLFWGQSAAGLGLGQFYRANVSEVGATTEILVGTCSPGATTFDVRTLTLSAESEVLVEAPVLTAAAWAGVFDYDGDGILDIAYLDEPGGDVSVMDRGLDGEVSTVATGIGSGPVQLNRTHAGDLDGDGREELLIVGDEVGDGAYAYELLYLAPASSGRKHPAVDSFFSRNRTALRDDPPAGAWVCSSTS